MEVEVRLHGALRQYRPPEAPGAGPFSLAVAEGATPEQVILGLGIPSGWVRSVFVNEQASGRDRTLHPGDKLFLFPPAAGGNGSTPGVLNPSCCEVEAPSRGWKVGQDPEG